MGLGAVYVRCVRWLMPKVEGRYAGIRAVRDKRFGDDLITRVSGKPLGDYDDPNYEFGLVRGISLYVRPGDKAVVIGGGFGITAVLIAHAAGPAGSVVCFEGSGRQVAAVSDTARRNGAKIDVRHAFVGTDKNVYGSSEGAVAVDAENLPECDVLEMDCEGAELAILSALKIRPRVILVETHGVHGSPTEAVRAELTRMGYDVDSENFPIGAGDIQAMGEEHDIFVLHAHRQK